MAAAVLSPSASTARFRWTRHCASPSSSARPPAGAVRVFDRPGDHAELVHLAPHRAAAELWLSEHGYPQAVLEEVTADEAAADAVEGRVVA